MKKVVLPAAAAILSSATAAETTPLEEVAIARADEPIEINGNLDKPVWKKATLIRVDYIKSKPAGTLSDEPRMTARYAWDEHYLYIAYETFDKNLIAISKRDSKDQILKKGPESNQRETTEIWSQDKSVKVDVAEFFISFGDEHFFWEIHHNALNQFNDVWCVVADRSWPIYNSKLAIPRTGIILNPQQYIQDDGEFTVKMAVHLKPKADGTPSTVNNADDTDTGYTAEIRLPWGGLGAPENRGPHKSKETTWNMDGQQMTILAVVQDGDLGPSLRYHHSSPRQIQSWFHTTGADWPRYVLGVKETKKE